MKRTMPFCFPVVIPEIIAAAEELVAGFRATDAAVLNMIFGKAKPGGKLSFELPSTMVVVRSQKEDLHYSSGDPLYKFGFGLSRK